MGRKSKGNVMDLVTIGITILAMSVIVMVYLECTALMMKKLELGQVSRNYILQMETKGYLDEAGRQHLLNDLQLLGVQNIDISGTTLQPVGYGENITLHIKGTIGGRTIGDGERIWNEGFYRTTYAVEETRMSTAKY